MSNKIVKEWSFTAPWGKVAMISWGNPDNPPVLLLHGFMDSAATFIPLIHQLPDKYYYVGFDMPGHGKSDTLPPGLIVSKLHMVEAVRRVVKHMKWKKFIFMSHSMGCIIGLFFHHLFRDYITKMIFLDIGITLSNYYFVEHRPESWYNFYKEYYDDYQKLNSGKPRLYTYDKAISLVVRNRSLTEEQAEIILSRSLIPMGIDTYKLSWEPRMKKITSIQIPEETIYTVMTTNLPPTLNIDASETISQNTLPIQFAVNLLTKCEQSLPNFYRVTVTGGHDVHITHPELIAPFIKEFMKINERDSKKLTKFKSNL